ncbi:peptidoglycan DD-metalloendopeptidase family protein [Rugamonas sp.]|uniref:peptidoglycan DD-metalloendopeptidase family protein n=1 Tax=Rugamonas sp. TaxID=1926287 RepID=UPI0025F2C221|nr:peptidoglycan DD-metalloendopeptidase family protein [Rugamonas sp.]
MTDIIILSGHAWPLRFLQASVSCVLLGLIVWAALRWAARRWPMLAAQRAVWPAAQLTVAAAFALTLAPQSARFGMLPALRGAAAPAMAMATTTATAEPIIIAGADVRLGAAAADMASTGAAALDIAATPMPTTLSSSAATPMPDVAHPAPQPTPPAVAGAAWMESVALCWMLAYGAGFGYAVLRLLRARRLWRALLVGATELSPAALREHGAFTPPQLAQIAALKLAVLETGAAISPMLIGAWRPRLLLPRHLRDFSAAQQHLIIEHELTHARRRDPLHLALSCALRTVLWFNPALRWLDRQLAWAQELSCDQLVLAGRPQHQRQHYAAALLRQLTTQSAALPSGGVAFGTIDGGSVAARVRQMRHRAIPSLNRVAACALAAAMAALLAAAALLQPAYAITDAAPAAAPSATDTNANLTANAAAEIWRYPLDQVRVTGFYAVQRRALPIHHGIDFAAAQGTPVRAVAAGTVIAAGPFAEHQGRYGNVVMVEHRGQPRSLYAHLGSEAVKVGDTVSAGQVIGHVGATGIATGPHLHFEAREGDQQIDPQRMLAGLDQLATPHALRVRRQQLGH